MSLDKENRNNHWQKAYKKEMFQVDVAFKVLKDDESIPVGYKKASGQLLSTCKMDFTLKARWVKNGHLTLNLNNYK